MSKTVQTYTMEQGSPEWRKVRTGVVTASVIGKLFTAGGKISEAKGVEEMARVIAAERINGFTEEPVSTRSFERGHLQEVLARELYEELYAPVEQVGFIKITCPEYVTGMSPDGLVGDEGGVEIKSRLGKFQIETFLCDEVPKEHITQVQVSLFVTGRRWWDYVQYSNGMALYRRRVEPDLEFHGKINEALTLFEERVQRIITEYKEKTAGLPVADFVDVFDINEEALEEAGL